MRAGLCIVIRRRGNQMSRSHKSRLLLADGGYVGFEAVAGCLAARFQAGQLRHRCRLLLENLRRKTGT